jgi:hypothetical protein
MGGGAGGIARRRRSPQPLRTSEENVQAGGAWQEKPMMIEKNRERDTLTHLHQQADKCRMLARSISDEKTIAILKNLARDYDDEASRLERELRLDRDESSEPRD